MEPKTAADQSSTPTVLDTRGLEAPQPVLTILKQSSEIPLNGQMEVILDQHPFHLYDLLQQRGFVLIGQREKDGSFRGVVRRMTNAKDH